MKTASKVMYTIGIVLNIFMIFVLALLTIAGVLINLNAEAIATSGDIRVHGTFVDDHLATAADISVIGTVLIIVSVIAVVIYIVAVCLGAWANKSVGNEKREIAPHIVMIVVGVISTDIFYLLGGVFGLISENGAKKE